MNRWVACVLVVWLAGCGAEWFDVPRRAPALSAVCSLPVDGTLVPTDGSVGMLPVCADVFVDPELGVRIRREVRLAYASAVERITAFYGRPAAMRPIIVVCLTDACRMTFVGDSLRGRAIGPMGHVDGAQYVSSGRRTVVLAVPLDLEETLVHELSHVELGARTGDGDVPAWFDEGLATWLQDPDDIQCRRDREWTADLDEVADPAVWTRETDEPQPGHRIYCAAKVEFGAWLALHGRAAVLDLLRRVRAGASFGALYGRRLTRGDDRASGPRARGLGR